MTEPVDTPIVVNPSTTAAAGGSLARDLLVIAAAVPIVIKLIGAHDLTGLLQSLQSSDGATVLTILLPIAASGWRAWRANRVKDEKVTMATVVPDAVAVIKGAGA